MDCARARFRTFCADEDGVGARGMTAFSPAIATHLRAADHGGRTRTGVLEPGSTRLLDG